MDWWVIAIPFVSGGVGWLTNALAVLMLFHPKQFVGIPPFLGWQGVIPRFTPKAASIAASLIADNLIKFDELVNEIDNDELVDLATDISASDLDPIVADLAPPPMANFWSGLTADNKQSAVNDVLALLRPRFPSIIEDLKRQATDLIDIESILYAELSKDPDVIVRIIKNMATPEIQLVRRSGLYFGVPFGIVQMVAWIILPVWWLLPVTGFLVGYFTNWAALLLIMEPKQPRKVGPVTFQGLFHRRRSEITEAMAADFAALLNNPQALAQHVLHGPRTDAVGQFIRNAIQKLDASLAEHPLRQMVGHDLIENLDYAVIARAAISYVDANSEKIEATIIERLGIEDRIKNELQVLDDESYEAILRSVFKQEEWLLLLIGGLIGMGVGWMQFIYLFAT